MPAPAPFASAQPLYPALYLYPLNDSFIPKHIYLPPNTKVKIGRQTNAKTAPGERNGYFDSKVLSRQHAEVWEENGKVRATRSARATLTRRRYTYATSRAQTGRLSTATDCLARAWSPNHMSSSRMI